ncbi:MAG: hypothetical protein KCHDKBKB_02257 [Elusimicrobia bacterium]|nr:hypothetical protein [Elusimicrobiota bacterium]
MSEAETKPAGATPDPDLSGLIDPRLSDPRARNAAELAGILETYKKYVYERRRKFPVDWVNEPLIRETHRKMFGHVWSWAGKYRTTNMNIGINWPQIPEQVKILCGDFSVWNSDQSGLSINEVAARLQNRLTKIHPFENGNGRHARLITDMFFRSRNHPLPTWPQTQLMQKGGDVRKRYVSAMKAADEGDFTQLAKFIEDCFSKEFPSN